jgi:hypothetical protein
MARRGRHIEDSDSGSDNDSMKSAPSAEAHPIVYSGDSLMSFEQPGSMQVGFIS